MAGIQITRWNHEILRTFAVKGGFYIDATMGNGKDTCFLCGLAGEKGRVLAFDIQPAALENTEKLLERKGCLSRAKLILDGHEHMDRYAPKESADVICFNFGYLPGGDHGIATKPETSQEAVRKGLEILRPGGIMSLCIYSGKDTGFEEKKRLLAYLQELPAERFTVIASEYRNRKNNPPIPVFVFKDASNQRD